MNVRAHAQQRHARHAAIARPVTLQQLLRSLAAYGEARARASANQDAYLEQLRAHATLLARELTQDLELAGAAYVHVSWDLAAHAPTYARIDPASLQPSVPLITPLSDGRALSQIWRDEVRWPDVPLTDAQARLLDDLEIGPSE